MFGKKEEKSIIDIAKEFEDNTSNPETPAPNPTDKSVPEVTHIKDTLASLLEHVKDVNTFVEFNLPSLGKLYHDYDKETVKIRPLKFADEKKIQQQAAGDRALDALNSILASCIEGPKFKTLTIPDKIYCLYRLRQLSYGSTYTYPLKCDACAKENEVNYELSTMPVNYLEGSEEEITTVILPDSKRTAVVKVLRVADESAMSTIKDIVVSLPMWVKSIEDETDRNIIALFVEGTTVRDVAAIRKAIFQPAYGMDTNHQFFCTDCGAKNMINIGINSNFFFTS